MGCGGREEKERNEGGADREKEKGRSGGGWEGIIPSRQSRSPKRQTNTSSLSRSEKRPLRSELNQQLRLSLARVGSKKPSDAAKMKDQLQKLSECNSRRPPPVSVLSLLLRNLPGVSILRLLRTFRVLRLFHKVGGEGDGGG